MGVLGSEERSLNKRDKLAGAIGKLNKAAGRGKQPPIEEVAERYFKFINELSEPMFWAKADANPRLVNEALGLLNQYEELLGLPPTAVLTDPRDMIMLKVIFEVQKNMAQGKAADSQLPEIYDRFGRDYLDGWFLRNVKNPALMMEDKAEDSKKTLDSGKEDSLFSGHMLDSLSDAKNFAEFLRAMEPIYLARPDYAKISVL